MKISKIASLCLVGSAAFIIGCGGSGGSSSGNTASTSSTVSGSAVDETIANGVVKVYAASLNGKILSNTKTDENGSYSAIINGYTGPIIVKVTCDANSLFIEDNGSKIPCDLNTSLYSANLATGRNIITNVTPITTQMLIVATDGNLSKPITSTTLTKAKQKIAYIYGVAPVTTNPVDNSTYKTIIKTMHTVAKDNNTTMTKIIEALNTDAKKGVIGENNLTKQLMSSLKNNKIKSPALDSNKTTISLADINTSVPYNNGIKAVKSVVQSLRNNLYSISNKDQNGTLDKEVKDFNSAINRSVVQNTQSELYALSYVLDASVDNQADMSGIVHQNGNTYDYNVTANSNNTEFNYTITWNGKDYKGIVKTSQNYKDVNSMSDLQNDMFLEINGSLPSIDNKTIYAKATAHKNNNKTFNFNLIDAKIKGDKDYLEIKNIEIDGKYFTYKDPDNNETDADLSYIRFNNIELNSKLNNQFEINGTLSLNWIQNSSINNKYPQGSYQKLYWLSPVLTCKDTNNNENTPNGGNVIFKYNGINYQLNSSWSNDYEMAFEKDFDNNTLIMSDQNGDFWNYVENPSNYDLSNVQCPSGYSPKIEWVDEDIDSDFSNSGYVPNKITFNGSVKDITTNVEMDGKIEVSSPDIQSVDLTKEHANPTINTSLNVDLQRPNYPNTILNADITYSNNKTAKLNISYNYKDDIITLLANWNADQSGKITIKDLNGVQINIPVNTNGDPKYDTSLIEFEGVKVGQLENRGNNLPVIHYNDGQVESLN